MARPRGIPDEQLLAAAQGLLYEVGPAAFTLDKAASRAGVSAATLHRGRSVETAAPVARPIEPPVVVAVGQGPGQAPARREPVAASESFGLP